MVETMPSSLLTEWLAYLDLELNEHTKQDYYLAQVSAQVSKGLQGGRTRIKDFLLEFGAPKESLRRSRSAWESVTGKKAL